MPFLFFHPTSHHSGMVEHSSESGQVDTFQTDNSHQVLRMLCFTVLSGFTSAFLTLHHLDSHADSSYRLVYGCHAL